MSILYGGRGSYIISRNHDARPRKIIGYNHTVPIYGNERKTHYTESRTGVRRQYADTANFDRFGQPRKPVVTKDEPLGRDMVRQQAKTRRVKVANRSGKRSLRT
jgi:hypothetical protein